MTQKNDARRRDIAISFEFFPPKSEEMEGQLWNTVRDLQDWNPEFVSVTYGAGGTTKAPTLSTVTRFLADTPLATASHLTCVSATKEETHQVVDSFRKAGLDVEQVVDLHPGQQGEKGLTVTIWLARDPRRLMASLESEGAIPTFAGRE